MSPFIYLARRCFNTSMLLLIKKKEDFKIQKVLFQYIHVTINLKNKLPYNLTIEFQYIHVTINHLLHLLYNFCHLGFNTSMLLLIRLLERVIVPIARFNTSMLLLINLRKRGKDYVRWFQYIHVTINPGRKASHGSHTASFNTSMLLLIYMVNQKKTQL